MCSLRRRPFNTVKEGRWGTKRQKCKYLPHKGKNVSTFLPLLPASYALTRHPSCYEIARQLLVANSLPNKQTNQQRHRHSGPPEAVSGIDLSSGIEVGDKRGGGWSGELTLRRWRKCRAHCSWIRIHLTSIRTEPSIKVQQLSNLLWPVSMPLGTFLLRETFLVREEWIQIF